MPLQKLQFVPGINQEKTRYSAEGGWYDCDKVRFRQGFPEKIGGWSRISITTFEGVCRSLWNWTTLGGLNLVGVGTNLKFYIESGGSYTDITPLRATVTLTNPFTTQTGANANIVTVTDANGGYTNGDFVTFAGSGDVGGIAASVLNAEHQITYTAGNTYTITLSQNASSVATGGGTVTAAYQINVGPTLSIPLTGWGAGSWGAGTWGFSGASSYPLRLWSQANFGEDLIFAQRGGAVYYWEASTGLVNNRAVLLSSLNAGGAVPENTNRVLVSDVSRFVFCFGANPFGGTTFDPMLVRWSDQGDATNWVPSAVTQAGGLSLSRGTEIVAAIQSRQEVLVWTDAALYSLQYVGADSGVWGAQTVGENISIASQNAVAFANGISYWMGKDKFYKYDGRTQPLRCDVKRSVFNDFNSLQYEQVFAGTNEGFHEIWWFYCSADTNSLNKYVIYNYVEDTWYHGNLSRTAWLDSGLRDFPLAATYNSNLVNHEEGVDDNELGANTPITATISSGEFDIEDGDRFSFVHRVIPDITFNGSTAVSPTATMTLSPLNNSGSGYNNPASVGGSNSGAVIRTAVVSIEQFTGQVNTRVRGRQLSFTVSSDAAGVTWQLGSPRIDVRPDGRR
tara:strand:- start:1106 stop:2971 length:1866 start_codon:yes stop_codon:yes gene_type:complete